MTRFIKTAAFAAALIPAAAQADTITLDAPAKGYSLHENGIDMNVFFLALDTGAYEVVATYAAQAAPGDAQRLIMALQDGDATRFALPGHADTVFSFERDGTDVTVIASPADRKLAMAQ